MMTTDKKELRQKAVERLTEEVALLLRQSENEQLKWKSTRLDLMEALYEVFLTQQLKDDDGMVMPFIKLVKKVCGILHFKVPSNPYDCAARGRARKGCLRQTYLDRYQYMLQVRGNKEPLWEEIY